MNKKVVLYSVASDYSILNLIDKVNKSLKEGWELVGGISVAISPGSESRYHQAMSWSEKPEMVRRDEYGEEY